MTLKEVADALENHPDARPYHKLLALEVRARRDPALADQYVTDAVQRFGNTARLPQSYQGGADLADETLLALAGWLNKIGRPAKTLEVLPQARAIQRQDLFLQYINALVALQRWNEVKDLFLSEHSVVDPMVQHMYLAVAQARLGSATGATNEWQRALQVANTPEKLLTLATNAEQNSVSDIADAAYSEAIKTAPTKIGPPMLAGCVLRSRPEIRLRRKRSQRRSLSCGQMTRQPAIRMLTCDCCSALQVMQPKQRNATLRS